MRASATISRGADLPRVAWAPGSRILTLCTCPRCGKSFPLTLSIAAPAKLHPSRPAPTQSSPPLYALRQGLRAWSLTFAGQPAELRHERGLSFVACLLLDPPDAPIHALDLIAKIPALYRRQISLPQLADLDSGKAVPPDAVARLEERGLAREDADTLRRLYRGERELEALLESETEIEPVKQEALRDLEAVAEFKRRYGRRAKDNAQRAAAAVHKAINRFQARLAKATDFDGRPHPVLRPFARHLEHYLLNPCARCAGGCFTYEPPAGVVWVG